MAVSPKPMIEANIPSPIAAPSPDTNPVSAPYASVRRIQIRLMGPIGAATRNPMIRPGMTRSTELIRVGGGKGCSCGYVDHETPAYPAGHNLVSSAREILNANGANHGRQ